MQSSNDVFNQAVRNDSNLEMDWLWLAKAVSSDAEREYCFNKVLYINPLSIEARRELMALKEKRRQQATRRLPLVYPKFFATNREE